jgi:hypothetical protein
MQQPELVEWQKMAPNGLVYPWWTHPFLDLLEEIDLSKMDWLEFGAGYSTGWLRSRCRWVDSIEANREWAAKADKYCRDNQLSNGIIFSASDGDIADGVLQGKLTYFDLIPEGVKYDIISVDGIFRYECLQWALDHFKGRGGMLIADNWQQDYVWISPAAEELMRPYEAYTFYQPSHANHEGKPWNTTYWIIPI